MGGKDVGGKEEMFKDVYSIYFILWGYDSFYNIGHKV